MGCVVLSKKAEPAIDWFEIESRLRELAKPSSSSSSELASAPHVTLGHDPHDPLALFDQFRKRDQLTSNKEPAANEPSDPPAQAQPDESGRDPLDMVSLLAAISSTRF